MTKQLLALCIALTIIVHLSAQDWQQLNDTPFFKHHSNGFGFEGKAYIIEGTAGESDENGVSNEVWEYTPETDTWQRLNDFPGPGRAIAIGDDLDGKYYYGFGRGENGLLSDLWEYDPTTDMFTELPSCPCVGRSHPALVAHNNKIFMGSGTGQDNDLSDWWVYDMETMEWSQKEDIPGNNRHHPFQFGIDDAIYVGGGHISNWSRWDIESETWSQIDNLPGGRVAGSQFSHKGKGYVLSGDSASHGALETDELFMEYDSQADLWTSLPPHPGSNRWACSSFIIDDALYLFGGYPYADDFVRDSSMWKFDMDVLACLAPSNLNAVSVTDTEAGLFWFSSNNSEVDTLLWRQVGDPNWTIVVGPEAVHTLSNLEACQDYEFRVLSQCADLVSNYSEALQFSTDGCCTTPELVLSGDEESINVEWNGILAASEYQMRWKATDNTEWNTITETSTDLILSDVFSCTEYEFQIKPICAIAEVDYSSSIYYLTKGCGACLDIEYCTVGFDDSEYLFIDKVAIDDYENDTGDDGGYANYGMPDAQSLKIGESFSLSVEIGSSDLFAFGSIGAWIDFNGDGEFSDSEQIMNEGFVEDGISQSIEIPSDAQLGLTKLRILTTWEEEFDGCGISDWSNGEVEDYCVVLENSSNAIDAWSDEEVTIYPNPFSAELSIDLTTLSQSGSVKIYNSIGSLVFTKQYEANQEVINIPGEKLSNGFGVYYCLILDSAGKVLYAEKVTHSK